jgi:GxxExxY protein
MPYGETTDAATERIATEIVDAAFKVHSQLGAGLLECIYVACLVYELRKRGLQVETEVIVPVFYDGVRPDVGLRLDLLVKGKVIIEAKAVEKIIPVHDAQLLTYLKLSQHRLGFLINFNTKLIKDGIKRFVL